MPSRSSGPAPIGPTLSHGPDAFPPEREAGTRWVTRGGAETTLISCQNMTYGFIAEDAKGAFIRPTGFG
jgi:hypothetical protein